jgi:coenzyme F420-reducing hydrogenase alpha subunit
MGRTIEINPVTRIEGHAKVTLVLDDDGKVADASLHVLEFRGFERFVQGMQVELMPTLTTRICGTCPHAHHLVAAKAVDRVFGVTPPRAAVLLRELLNCGSMIHSHAIHFFALAGPDLLLGIGAPPEQRSVVALLDIAPDLARKALELRSLGQRIVESVGGRGTHPITCVAGGMSAGIDRDEREKLQRLAARALELARVALEAGKGALARDAELLRSLPLSVANLGTVNGGQLDLYDGALRLRRADGTRAAEFGVEQYREYLHEEALPHTYAKQTWFRDPAGGEIPYRVGPLARLNVVDGIDTPLAAEELGSFRAAWGDPCDQTVLGHHARLIELLHHAEKAVRLLADDEIVSPHVRAKVTGSPRGAIAHVEAPRGVLIHDYEVDANGLVRAANFLVATQHNVSSINASLRAAAEHFLDRPEPELLNGVEFAIRCYDPCLSCATHQVGKMPIEIALVQGGRVVRRVRRS